MGRPCRPTVLTDLRSIGLPRPFLKGYVNTLFEIQGQEASIFFRFPILPEVVCFLRFVITKYIIQSDIE